MQFDSPLPEESYQQYHQLMIKGHPIHHLITAKGVRRRGAHSQYSCPARDAMYFKEAMQCYEAR